MKHKQQLIITIEAEEGATTDVDINLSFEPGIMGTESKEFKNATDTQKGLQNFTQHLAVNILKTLK